MDHIKSTAYQGLIISIILLFVFSSCMKEEEISTNPAYKLSFSTDTIIFDTIFTTVGSTTRVLKVYNKNNEKVNINRIQLAEGSHSQYDININGTPATSLNNIEIDADDSLFIFVRVKVDPTLSNAPLIISDSLLFETNGNNQDVNLVAWGQDAHFIVGNQTIEGLLYPYSIIAGENETVNWEDDKPYVVYGWAVVDSAGQLVIGPGVDVHFHQNSGLWVYRGGNIQVNGEKDSLVVFQGDRLEMEYKDLAGQWDRIWINEGSENNVFNYAVIKNGFIGIQAETLESDPTLNNVVILNNTQVINMSRWGLFTIASRVFSTNSIFANCAENTLFISVGGIYDFRHCTFANYWTSSIRQDPSFTLSNNLTIFSAEGSPITYLGNLDAYFGNCIIYGNVDEEILFSEDEAVDFNFTFDYCLLKTFESFANEEQYINCFKNNDPLFVNPYLNNYHLDTLSPASDMGSIEVINTSQLDISLDWEGNLRTTDGGPDLGAYEFIPEGN